MIKRIYIKTGQATHALIRPVLRQLATGKNRRARIIVLNKAGDKILLVRSWMSEQLWSLPGGGIKKGENDQTAAARELLEETGLSLDPAKIKFLGEFKNPRPHTPYRVICFTIKVDNFVPKAKGHYRLEVLDGAWFGINDLPKNTHPVVIEALKLQWSTRSS